jgi:two-component system phosphate regulon sensor histidine kinase PhoR
MILRRPRTLLWQLGLGLMLVQAAAIFAPAWFAYSQFQSFLEDQTARTLAREAPLLADRYSGYFIGPGASRLDELQALVRADGARTGRHITVVFPDGRVVADSIQDPAAAENLLSRPEIEQALAAGTGVQQRGIDASLEPTVFWAVRILQDERPLAVVRIAATLSAGEAAASRMVRLIALVGGISLVATLAVIYLVSRQLSATISGLAISAGRFAAGDLAHRIDRPPSRELAALADVLNHMARRLSEQIDLLRAQRNEQQAIYQSMSNGMIALDMDQRVLSMNRAAEQMLGVEERAARGRLLQEVVREPALNRFVAAAMAGDHAVSNEFRLSRRVPTPTSTGAARIVGNSSIPGLPGMAGNAGLGLGGLTVQLFSEPLRNVRDEAAGLLVVINDVTHLRRLESIRSDFAANVSHELRTPITNIRGYVETLQDVGVDDRQQSAKFLDIIKRNTDRLASIVEDLLALARLEAPNIKATLEKTATPMHRITDAVISQFDPAAREKRIVITSSVPRDLSAEVNAHLIEQAVGNLLSNAIKYSATGTSVTVSATAVDHEVEIAVADQGPGIEAEHLPRLFERFYRVDKARSREMGGTGLGLAIAKHIALVHGGRIGVESEVGKGSVFRIIVPAL